MVKSLFVAPKLILYAGKMPTRKTLITITIKIPKEKLREAGEGSLRKSVEFNDVVDDYVLVIQIPTVEEPIVLPFSKDTDTNTNSMVLLKGWNDLFLKFKYEYYPGTDRCLNWHTFSTRLVPFSFSFSTIISFLTPSLSSFVTLLIKL
jgi:hypothetical protein